MPYPITRDKYKSKRGGQSKLLEITCRQCGASILTYQKDGPGSLLRLYLDRIHSPASWVGLQHLPLGDIPYLKCPGCQEFIGTPYIYAQEKRPAFRLRPDAIIKKTLRSNGS